MLTKIPSLSYQSKEKHPAVYLLVGHNTFQVDTLAEDIIKSWKTRCSDHEIKRIDWTTSNHWIEVEKEAFHYTLFAQDLLLDIRYEKKTLDPSGKKFLTHYLEHPNPRCLIILRTYHLSLKDVNLWTHAPQCHILFMQAPNAQTIKQWIQNRLQAMNVLYEHSIPDMIYQYNEGNLFGCEQILKKIPWILEKNTLLTAQEMETHLVEQSHYPVFDLANACLTGQLNTIIRLLQQAQVSKTEPTLIVWILAQEIRTLMQLQYYLKQNLSFAEAAKQAKIWAARIALYQKIVSKYDYDVLVHLLMVCIRLDKNIKTNASAHIWQVLELVALSLGMGKIIQGNN